MPLHSTFSTKCLYNVITVNTNFSLHSFLTKRFFYFSDFISGSLDLMKTAYFQFRPQNSIWVLPLSSSLV